MDKVEISLIHQIRLILLLDTAEVAGLTPIPILQLHTFAYLSNVLSPVWGLVALDGKVLKRHGSPFYPTIQNELDRLVGIGVVLITKVSHVIDEDRRWRLQGTYCLNRLFADRILNQIRNYEYERRFIAFLQELAYALSALSTSDMGRISDQDATYADPIIDVGSVVDFAEWRNINYSANAARFFEHNLPNGTYATQGEMLHLYVRHLHRRLHRGG